MTRILLVFFLFGAWLAQSQDVPNLILKGDFSERRAKEITHAFVLAEQAVEEMKLTMDEIWEVDGNEEMVHHLQRKVKWENNNEFMTWLGRAERIGMVRRKINRIHKQFKGNVTLEMVADNKGRCAGWIGAWTIPFGRTKIRICDAFFEHRTHLHEKILIHEMGHEAGMFLHHRIHICWIARRAAAYARNNVVKRSPENYAWLAATYLGMRCGG
ncbi:MAG: hypothetical protein JXQ90_01700 [Cyclobacteriaceae bacterium]